MTIVELSQLLHKSPNVIASGIKQGVFPFVVGNNMGGKKMKTIVFPRKLQEYVTGAKGEYDLSTKGVARLLGCDQLTVQVFLQLGLLPFGVAFKTRPESTKYTYVIFPAKLEEYLVEREEEVAS